MKNSKRLLKFWKTRDWIKRALVIVPTIAHSGFFFNRIKADPRYTLISMASPSSWRGYLVDAVYVYEACHWHLKRDEILADLRYTMRGLRDNFIWFSDFEELFR